jgi:hypothetical protein
MADQIPDLAGLQGLIGTAYRWYADAQHVRADDLLVRSRAGDALGRAAAGLRQAEAAARRAIPAPTRADPFPDQAASRRLADVRRLHDRVLALETRLRGAASLPDRDFTMSHGVDVALRGRLVACDAALIAAAEDVAGALPDDLETVLATLERRIDARAATMQCRA